MKQTTQKLFRGCPYQYIDSSCEACLNYQKCKEKKEERKCERRARKVEFILNVLLPNALLFITAITAVVALVMCASTASADFDVTHPAIATSSAEQFVGVEDEITTVEELPLKEVIQEEVAVPEESPSEDDSSEEYLYNISEEDKLLIAKLVWKEARGESFEGKVAVAAVVLNRYYYGEDKDFNRESIESVVKQPGQFASIQNVTREDLQEVPECMEAVRVACNGGDPTREVFSEGALYFFAHDKVSGHQKEIREGLKVMVIENHSFHYDFEKVR